ncbi:SDR family NAD(P)-dependent oxidoreductase [Pseudogemmobacter faecipullorum]|uniref:SDR family oxidoreductase n=1 Tax=Pseudogemmobacter faecipullorum TaxID=2755041 RepID=A0ABS8CJU0_9RHOB|nr:SDR family oxidoreductase [Pseudogemmobacter faecipullorum]MCB5409656.1 SDR family oxidoreductase [Pseudogemmobacter faecipullorum]
MSFSVTGKTAIVTGASSGLGLAVARHLLDKGANVMLADSDEARLEAEMGEGAWSEGPARLFAGDLNKKLSLVNLVSATVDAFDQIDILVNANRRCLISDALDPESDQVEALWQQNVLSTLRLSQLVAKRMIQRAAGAEPRDTAAHGAGPEACIGSIINFSSVAAVRVQPELLAYSMASAAVEQMTRTLAVTLASKGIRVNAVSIGSVMSASLQNALKDQPDLRRRIENGTPLGRIAAPDELAETIQYLASEASRFVTGQVIVVDGGRGLLDAVSAPAF